MTVCMFADYRNKPLLNGSDKPLPHMAWMTFLLFALLSAAPAAAQVADTVRVGQDSVGVGQDMDHGQEANVQGTRQADRMVLRSIPDSVVRNWQKDPDFAY